MREEKMLDYGVKNRELFPKNNHDGSVDIDLSSGKFTKVWQGTEPSGNHRKHVTGADPPGR